MKSKFSTEKMEIVLAKIESLNCAWNSIVFDARLFFLQIGNVIGETKRKFDTRS